MSPPGNVPSGAEPASDGLAPAVGALQNSAMRGTWWTAIQGTVVLPLSFIVNIVVARTLGPHGYGTLATYMAAYGLTVTVLNAGISDATIQWGASAFARGNRAELVSLARRCAGFHIMVEAPLVALATLVVLHGQSAVTQAVGAAAVGITMVMGTTLVVLTAVSLTAPLAKLNLVVGVGTQLAVVTAAVRSHSAGPTWVARLAVATAIPLAAWALAPKDIRVATLKPLMPWRWPAGFVRFSSQTLVGGLAASLVFSRCEVFILDAYGMTAGAGLYALAAGLAVQITSPVDAMLGPLTPAAASLVAANRDRAAGAILRGIRLSGLATAPIVTAALPTVAILSPVIYGHKFEITGELFVSLGVVSCLQSVLHPMTAFLAAWRRPLLLLAVSGAALAVDLGLTAALVPWWGPTGAVVGNTAGQIISLSVSVTLLRRFVNLSAHAVWQALSPFGCSALAGAAATVGGLVAYRLGIDVWLSAATALVAGSLTAGVLVRWVGGAVKDEDLGAVQATFPRMSGPLIGCIRRLGLIARNTAVA